MITRTFNTGACIALLLALYNPGYAHDLISKEYLRGEQALADLQKARDQVLKEPQTSPNTKQAAQAFVATAFKWDHTNFTVCFWQTDKPDLLRAIADQANRWTAGTKITFDYGSSTFRQCTNAQSADIRVTTIALPDAYYAANDLPLKAWDWSEYGNLPSKTMPYVSMSLVHAPRAFAFNSTVEFNFLVAHEFGHALSLIHEHQRPEFGCTRYLADKETVKAAYGWTNDSDYNTFVANLAQIPTSDPALRPIGLASPDIQSIMVYNFLQGIWRTDVANNPCARQKDVQYPDTSDIAGINYLYGPPTPVAVASPPAPAAPVAGLLAAPQGLTTPAAPAVSQPAPPPSALSQMTHESARLVLQGAHQRHSNAALTIKARGGGGVQRQSHARAAASLRNLLDTMERAINR